jgi:hypothetical protein
MRFCSTQIAAFSPPPSTRRAINVFTISGASLPLEVRRASTPSPSDTRWARCAQLAIVWFAARRGLDTTDLPPCTVRWREILMKPAFFVVYAAGIGLNITLRAPTPLTPVPGMAAALGLLHARRRVPLALLVQPISNSLSARNRPSAQHPATARSPAPYR